MGLTPDMAARKPECHQSGAGQAIVPIEFELSQRHEELYEVVRSQSIRPVNWESLASCGEGNPQARQCR